MIESRKERRSLRSRIIRRTAKIFSWITGVSLGSAVLVIMVLLSAAAVFVRTDTFQQGLRDRLVQVAKDSLGLQMNYGSADVKIFRLEPRVDFHDVELEHEQTRTLVQAERVSLGISVFISIPLLFFRQLYVSFVEIKGLDYELKSLKPILRFFDKVRPKSMIVPPAFSFQTIIREVRLDDVDVNVDLSARDYFHEKLKAQLEISRATATLQSRGILVDGDLQLHNFQYGSRVDLSGILNLQDLELTKDSASVDKLRFESGQDFIEVSGDAKRWTDPIIDISGKVSLNLSEYAKDLPIAGNLRSTFEFRGPWSRLQGEGASHLENFRFRHQSLGVAESEWSLNDRKLNFKKFSWKDSTGNGELTGVLSLNASEPSDLEIRLQEAQLGFYLGLFTNDLSRWRGQTSGQLRLRGHIPQNELAYEWQLKIDDYQIRTSRNDTEILRVPFVETQGSGSVAKDHTGNFEANIRTRDSQWTGNAEWTASNFKMQWTSDFQAPNFGTLFSKAFGVVGKMNGLYEGPLEHLVLRVDQDLSELHYNGQIIHNLKGVLQLKDRILSAEPFSADELHLQGGIYIPPGPRPDEFHQFQFRLNKVDINTILNFFGSQSERSFRGALSATGRLSGKIERPSGAGGILINDWAWGTDRTKGRIARSQFAFSNGEYYFDRMEIFAAQPGEPVRGHISLDSHGVSDAEFSGKDISLGPWLAAFDLSSIVQASADFNFDYQRGARLLTIDINVSETSLRGNSVPDSTIKLLWKGQGMTLRGNVFGDAISLQGRSEVVKNELRTTASLKISKLNAAPLILNRPRVDLPVEGEGEIQLTQQISKESYLRAFFSEPTNGKGSMFVRRASIKRGAVTIQTIDPFQIAYKKQGTKPGEWSIENVRVRSDRHLLELQGFFQSADRFHFTAKGTLDLRSIASLTPELSRSEGLLTVNGDLRPSGFFGRMNLREGILTIHDSPLILRSVQAAIVSEGPVLSLENLRGEFREGHMEASGKIRFSGGEVIWADIRARLQDTLINPQEGVSFRASGPIQLSVQGKDGVLKGDLRIRDGLYRRRVDMKADFVKLFETKKERYRMTAAPRSRWESYRLDVSIRTEDPFTVRNNVAEGQVNLNLRAIGTIAEPRLTGSISVLRGQFTYNRRTYTVRSGVISFTDPNANVPSLEIRADTEIDIYRLDIKISGTANNLKISYSSDPPLSEKEILNLISFGTPPQAEALPGDPRTSAAYAGISFITGQIQDRIEGGLSTGLGIKRFSLAPAFYEDTGQTELQLGVGTDLIRDRISVNYYNFLTVPGGHRVELDLRLTRNFSLIGSWRDVQGDNEDDFGGDLRFRFEFE